MAKKDITHINKKIEELDKRLKKLEEIHSESAVNADSKDELFQKAVKIIKEYDRVSVSLLQRRLKIGYARAARIIDHLEEEGYISSGEGSEPRKVLKK